MKQLITSVLILAALQFACAQSLLKGKLTDSGGQGLPGVTITERGTSSGTASGVDGTYTLRYSGSKDAVIVFTYIGYATQEIKANGQQTINVVLQTDAALLEQVVVVGTRRQNRVQTETPVPVDVINVNQVSMTTARPDVTSLLNATAPSFNFTKQTGADGSDHIDLATLRGLGPDQTLVLVNGKRRHQTAFVTLFGTRGRGNTGTDLGAISTSSIDRIEILRDGAAAQYGSDAIAGVINIILKKNIDHTSIDMGYSAYNDPKYNPAYKPELGQYPTGKKWDGGTFTTNVNFGKSIGDKGGFVNCDFNYITAGRTYRQELDDVLPVNSVRRAFGESSMSGFGANINLEAPIKADNRLTFYAFGGANQKSSDAYAYSRNFSGRPERFPTDATGNLIPVDGIIFGTSDGDQYYNPHIQTGIQDISIAAGFKGMTKGGWNWDLSNVLGKNDFHFYGDKTFNAGLGTAQTHFDDGGFSFLQNTTNLNFSKEIKGFLSGLNVAFGAEYRAENYKIYAGEPASYLNYNPEKATGSQGFPGFQPSDEVNAKRSCSGVYGDVELDLTPSLLLGVAVRGEHYSDFGSTFNYKLAARYKVFKNFNLRGSYSTGFRAPSLQQINFSNTLTAVEGGNIFEIKIAPNSNPITKAAGIPNLKQEVSQNASIGFSYKPIKELTVTVDAYQVKIQDRVVISGQFNADDTSLNPALTTALTNLKVGSAQFFANAVNTTNQGLDVVLDFNKRMENQHFRFLIAGNFQKMKIDKINVPRLLDDTDAHRLAFLSNREQKFILASAPPVKFSSTIEYGYKQFTVGVRLNYFGEVELLGYGSDVADQVPTDADATKYVPDLYIYHAKLVPDLYFGWQFCKAANLNLGIDNILNVHPDLGYVPAARGWAFNDETGGAWDAVQMGFNGMRLFARLSINF
jgi:iron complex outermembrane receptor protein